MYQYDAIEEIAPNLTQRQVVSIADLLQAKEVSELDVCHNDIEAIAPNLTEEQIDSIIELFIPNASDSHPNYFGVSGVFK